MQISLLFSTDTAVFVFEASNLRFSCEKPFDFYDFLFVFEL